MGNRVISIRGARTHNLRNVSVDLPHSQLSVITGPSGSGKSSLAFNTLYAEGQRRFVESMSTYVRQFLERMERPDVDAIDGILPAIAIEQNNSVKNARSMVATATEIADYARLFMTWCGETRCPDCDRVVRKESPESVTRSVMSELDGSRIMILAPVFAPVEEAEVFRAQLLRGGFFRVWQKGAIRDLSQGDAEIAEHDGMLHYDLVVGRFRVDSDAADRIADAIEQAFGASRGMINILEESGDEWISHRYSAAFSCDGCGREFPEPRPQLFSFNSPLGACTTCQGYGRVIGVDLDKVIPDRSRTLREQAIEPWNSAGYDDSYDDLYKAAKKYRLRLDVPIAELTEDEWKILHDGRGSWYGIRGFFDWLESKKYKVHVRVKLAKYRSYDRCSDCQGSRLQPEALHVRFRDHSIADLFAMNVAEARRFWEFLPLTQEEEAKGGHLRREILNRLVYLDEVGLSYLTLDRQMRTLSGGEAQRINLAAALGSGLTGTLYVVDEPSVGLHARDSERLLAVLQRLRNAGNTVVVVEHDPYLIRGADWLVRLGPGAGDLGGRIEYAGIAKEHPDDSVIEMPTSRTAMKPKEGIIIRNAREHNLKGIDVEIPLGGLVALTGVSGSGKSTLLRDCFYNIYQREHRAVASIDLGACDGIEGLEQVDDVQFVDQTPIGRSSRSNPATYVKAWDDIRKLLGTSTSAKLHDVTPGMFSFNTTGGRCDTCEGTGTVSVDMQFLADVEVICDQCDGKRFKDRVLKVTWKQHNVDQILAMTVDDACRFFADKRQIVRKLDALRAVGLGYLRLGQSTATLSGGEAQRLKLASFLTTSRNTTRRLFLFDEPTTGLHASDVAQLVRTFRDLIERGNSVVVIEHNMQLIAAADWIIDLGPEGGDAGGELVAAGTPEEIASSETSLTGRYLAQELARDVRAARAAAG